MSKQEIKTRIADLAKGEAEALAENDAVRFKDLRGKRNYLESLLG